MVDIGFDVLALLALAAFAAGLVDAIAGGGGLITLPALLLAGVPPVSALATNKLQGVFGAGMAAISYARGGHVDLRRQTGAATVAAIAGGIGAALAARLPVEAIRIGLPVLLIAVALFFAFKPGLNDIDRAQRLSPRVFALTFVPMIAFYDGLVGPGTGAFLMLGFVALAGFGVLRATAHTKLLNFASNIGSLAVFVLIAQPLWAVGLAMGAAQLAGAWLGARLAMRVGARLIRPVLVVAATALALRLLWDMA